MHSHLTKKSAGMILVILVLFILSGLYVWTRGYENRIGPNVFLGDIELSGMHPEIAKQLLQEHVDEIITTGLPVRIKNEEKNLPLATLIGTDLIEDVEYDLENTLHLAMNQSHNTNIFSNTWALVKRFKYPLHIEADISLNQNNVQESLVSLYGDQEKQIIEPRFIFTSTLSGWSALISPGVSGVGFSKTSFLETLENQLKNLNTTPIELSLYSQLPTTSDEMAEELIDEAVAIVNSAPFTLTHETTNKRRQTWFITQREISESLVPTRKGVGIDKTVFESYMAPIAANIDQPMQNARLEIENGRVVDFVESKEGIEINLETTYQSLLTFIKDPKPEGLIIATDIEAPDVKTEDVNDLGIREILGTGTSSYRGSPTNRRANIQNGVDLLNGLLIPPEETFSLIKALSPFELENGYLSELVIKGDEIKPEIGGGLCQIGTTTFRATMNSGLPVVERHNHSLVVSYYNDLSNGNPGTDATIYEPAPDFKFSNDTNSHVLFQAENLTETQELRFTFWGTSDGRKGSYSPPVVERWIPVGETRYVDTEDLEIDEEKCQEAHIGADASFDYTIVRPDGQNETQTFESHYRPLPKICLVGVEKKKDEVAPGFSLGEDATFPQE